MKSIGTIVGNPPLPFSIMFAIVFRVAPPSLILLYGGPDRDTEKSCWPFLT